MPYKDPEKQKEAKRKYYRRKYAEDPDFVEAERQRKLAHYEANREERLPQMRAYSQEWYASVEKKRRKAVQASEKRASASGNGRRPVAKKSLVTAKVARKLVAKTKPPLARKPKAKVRPPVPARRAGPAASRTRPLAKSSRGLVKKPAATAKRRK